MCFGRTPGGADTAISATFIACGALVANGEPIPLVCEDGAPLTSLQNAMDGRGKPNESEPFYVLTGSIDLNAFAKLFANVMLDMVFRDGFYHVEPHPGNVFVQPGGKLGMLDCGKVGRVDEQTQADESLMKTAHLLSTATNANLLQAAMTEIEAEIA